MYPISTRFISSASIGVFPTRSPIPIPAPCSRVAPASSAASELLTAKSRSRWPCQSMPTPPPHSSTTVLMNRTTAAAPAGVACPTVSEMHTRFAPARIAVEYRARSESGSARVVSSVTYITGRPSPTAKVIASSVSFSNWSRVQPSAYCRSGLDPMNVQHSIGIPARCETSAIGLISAITVRAAQFACTLNRPFAISRASRSTSRTTWAPAPGKPISAVSIPSRSIRCRIFSFSSIDGHRTEGDCSPSRRVSSSRRTVTGFWSALRFQS